MIAPACPMRRPSGGESNVSPITGCRRTAISEQQKEPWRTRALASVAVVSLRLIRQRLQLKRQTSSERMVCTNGLLLAVKSVGEPPLVSRISVLRRSYSASRYSVRQNRPGSQLKLYSKPPPRNQPE